jgi:hypothetical protein
MFDAWSKAIKIYREPKLSRPSLVAAWPGISNVALRAAIYLKEKLVAEEFAAVEPAGFFALAGATIEDNLILPPRFPESTFYYWNNPRTGRDLIIFLGEAQPAFQGYEFAHQILELAENLGVERIYTFAAALVSHQEDKPRVWAAATDPHLLQEVERVGLVLKGNFYITGMNGLLLAVAKERGLEGLCLLGETPHYVAQIQNPGASLAVLEALTRILDIDLDLSELEEEAKQFAGEMDRLARESQRQFIDRFTIPLWEQQRDEEENA